VGGKGGGGGRGGEMNQALYAHMKNKIKEKKTKQNKSHLNCVKNSYHLMQGEGTCRACVHKCAKSKE
jgi:hypothetical protein